MNIKKFLILSFIIFFSSFFVVDYCQAAEFSLLGNIGCIKSGDCTIENVKEIMIVLADFILAITGSLSLLAFVVGGVMFLISSGSSEKVSQAKRVITGAVIGMVIVFTSYTIIHFTLTVLGVDNIGAF